MKRTERQPGAGQARACAAARQRLRRQREREGLVVLPVELPEHDLAEALIAAGRLTESDALNRGRLAEASRAVILEWMRSFSVTRDW